MSEAATIEKASLGGHALAAEWLGIPGALGGRDRLRDLITKASPTRAQHIALVVVLAAIEARTGVQTWRRSGCESRYLNALESWGYTLSPVERIARGEKPTASQPGANTPAPTKVSATAAKVPTTKNLPKAKATSAA